MGCNSHSAAIASAVTMRDGVSWGEVCGADVIGLGEYWVVEQYGQLRVILVDFGMSAYGVISEMPVVRFYLANHDGKIARRANQQKPVQPR
jgi:hypothetical protein